MPGNESNNLLPRKMPIIDCEVHQALPANEVGQRLPAAFRETGWHLVIPFYSNPVGYLRYDAKPQHGVPGSCPKMLLEQHIKPHGIKKVILTGSEYLHLGVHPNMYYASALAKAYNETLVETWLNEDERFYGAIIIAPQDPESAVKEIQRWGDHPRIVQVLMTSGARIPFGQKHYWPIYQASMEVGLPVSTHPGSECAGIAGSFAAGLPSSYLEWHTNIPQNYMGHLVSLLCEGVFEKFAELKFICIEGGLAWIPHVLWRLDKNWKALRSTVPWLKKLPSEYAFEHIRFTTQPIEEPENKAHLEAILEMIQAERTVMFSSDYPHWDNDSPLYGLPKLDQHLAERIYYKNAADLYGFSVTDLEESFDDSIVEGK